MSGRYSATSRSDTRSLRYRSNTLLADGCFRLAPRLEPVSVGTAGKSMQTGFGNIDSLYRRRPQDLVLGVLQILARITERLLGRHAVDLADARGTLGQDRAAL